MPSLDTDPIGSAPYPLPLEQIEEAFRNSAIVAVSTPAHGVFQIVRPEK